MDLAVSVKGAPAGGADAQLVKSCLRGDEAAWSDLLDKYKRLIFSIPIRLGMSREDAADVFQSVSLLLVSQLSRLRDPQALPKWIIETTYHECSHHRRKQQRHSGAHEQPDFDTFTVDTVIEAQIFELQREQAIREAVTGLAPRCRTLVSLLFFHTPALPYREVAERLGLSVGSIGFIRGRCLDKLRRALEDAGI